MRTATQADMRFTWQMYRAAKEHRGRKVCCARLAIGALITAGTGARFGAVAGRGAAALGAHVLPHGLQPARLRADAVYRN